MNERKKKSRFIRGRARRTVKPYPHMRAYTKRRRMLNKHACSNYNDYYLEKKKCFYVV